MDLKIKINDCNCKTGANAFNDWQVPLFVLDTEM